MKLIQKHILTEFIRLLIITVVSMLALFFIVEVVERSDDLLEHGMPLRTAAAYFLYKIPLIFAMISPIAVLMAVLISVGMLNRGGEITAMKAGGIGLARIIAPLMLAGLVITGAVILINESVVPHTERSVARMESRWLEKTDKIHMGPAGLWLKSDNAVYNIRKVSEDRQTLYGVSVYDFSDGFKLARQSAADKAVWADGAWKASGALVWEFNEHGAKLIKGDGTLTLTGLKGPDELLGATRGYESMSSSELNQYIKGLKRDGYDTASQRVELYTKFTFPFVNFLMVLVAIPFAMRTGRGGGIASGVAISFIIGAGFWIIFGMSKSLGQTGLIPPIAAALFPDIVFLMVGVVMLGYVKQ